MTQPNPFAAAVPATPAEQHPNPFAAPAAVAAPVVPQAYAGPQQQAPAPNPFAGTTSPGWPQQAPVQQQAEPAYAPPVQTYAPPAAPGGGLLDPNALSAAGAPPASYAKGPELPDMYGRLLLIFPMIVETVQRNAKFISDEDRARGNITQERLTATIVVLDSGPGTPPGTGTISWGGSSMPPKPHTNHDPLPYVIKGKWISQSKIIGQCRAFVPDRPGGKPGMVAGRLVKAGPAHNDPWYLESATAAEVATAQQYLTLVNNGQYPHPLAP